MGVGKKNVGGWHMQAFLKQFMSYFPLFLPFLLLYIYIASDQES